MEKVLALFGFVIFIFFAGAAYWTYNYMFLIGAGVGLLIQFICLMFMEG